MAFAALWSPPTDACPDPSVAIVTVPASPGLERIHDRMPAVLTKRDVEVWLAGNTPLGDALQTLMPRGNEVPLVARRVTRYVNTPAHEGPGCVAPDLGDD
jgi:putative SOS response-associated peptidase YedK